jgi:hypothetical protein
VDLHQGFFCHFRGSKVAWFRNGGSGRVGAVHGWLTLLSKETIDDSMIWFVFKDTLLARLA